MNPAAQEFVPERKRGGAASSFGHHHQQQQQQQQQQQKKPIVPNQPKTQLRASAPEFVPKTSAVPADISPFPPSHHHHLYHQQHQQQQQQQTVHNVEPLAENNSDAPGCPDSKCPPTKAVPSTLTATKVAPKSPAPCPPATAEDKPSQQQQQQQTSGKPSSSSANMAESAPQEDSVESSSTTATEDKNAGSTQFSVLADSVKNDFSGSLLPKAFNVDILNKAAPADTLRFNTVWALYADDHPTMFGTPVEYDPVLVHLVGDVECFWRLWRYLPPPSALIPAFTYHWFRRDVKPHWEHPRNKNGGTITIAIFDRDKPGLNSKQTMDDAFMAMLLACCGETLSGTSTILNGMMLKVRQNKPTTVQLWTAYSDQSGLEVLAQNLRSILEKVIGSKPLQKLEYFTHQQLRSGGAESLAGRMVGKPTRITPTYTL